MRLGLLSDIHEDTARLSSALALCQREGADRILLLGDVFQSGDRFQETVSLLCDASVAGVWGNHEFGICHQPDAVIEAHYGGPVLDYMLRLRPRMEVEGALFGHVLPSLDPTDLTQPWYVVSFPETPEAAAAEFSAFPHARMFLGHYHRWAIATPEGLLDWSGERPFRFEPSQRYLVVVAAVCDGFCAVYDTTADVLTPLRTG
ncbi:MAG: metallophosphoesterase family protein [Isosphaeraceae bacterium]|nr:metallophosphoesterase family protein [Isosphaeraceae bacterium]